MTPIRLMLVDDHAILRRGVAALLLADGRYSVVAEASDGEEALAQLESIKVDLVLLDLYMPGLNGLDTIPRIKRGFPDVKTIILSMYDDEQYIARALREGARGYVLKQDVENELLSAIAAVMRGETYTSRPIDLSKLAQIDRVRSTLSFREREVLQLIVDGHTSSHIAELLFISPHTVIRHRANLMDKLNVHTQMELVKMAVERGLAVFSKAPLF